MKTEGIKIDEDVAKISLEGSPKEVGRSFYCSDNKLTSLEGIGEVKDEIYSDLD